MKKILCVMVAVVLCFGAVLVSASAETPMYNYNGDELPLVPSTLLGEGYKYVFVVKATDTALVASTSRPYTNAGRLIFLEDTHVKFYTPSSSDSWVSFGEQDISAISITEFKLMNIHWSNVDIVLFDNGEVTEDVAVQGDLNFSFPRPPLLHEVVGGVAVDSVNGLANDTFDTLGVLVPIGIAIMAIFLGVALIPRVIYKFL